MNELQIRKEVVEAAVALTGLEKELRKPLKEFYKGTLNEAKAKNIAVKVADLMKRFGELIKVQAQKDFETFAPQVQADVLWMDEVISSLMRLEGTLLKFRTLAKKPPEPPHLKIIIKSSKEYIAKVKTQPKGVGQLVKQIEKGNAIGGPEGALISFLPMIILLWLMADTIVRGLKSRKKVS